MTGKRACAFRSLVQCAKLRSVAVSHAMPVIGPDSELSISPGLSRFISPRPCARGYSYLHFTDKEIEAQRNLGICQTTVQAGGHGAQASPCLTQAQEPPMGPPATSRPPPGIGHPTSGPWHVQSFCLRGWPPRHCPWPECPLLRGPSPSGQASCFLAGCTVRGDAFLPLLLFSGPVAAWLN